LIGDAMKKIDATRQQITEMLGGRKFRMRRIDFPSLGDYAYALSVFDEEELIGGANVFSREYLERHEDVLKAIRRVKDTFTWKGKHIL
jgi:hypothetical protein